MRKPILICIITYMLCSGMLSVGANIDTYILQPNLRMSNNLVQYSNMGTPNIWLTATGIATQYLLSDIQQRSIIKDRIGLNIPCSSHILKFTYHYDGDYFYAKVMINDEDYNSIKKQVETLFYGESKRPIEEIPNFIYSCKWWDLDRDSIDTYYTMFMGSKLSLNRPLPLTHNVWAFITGEINNTRYLFLSY